MLQVTVISRRRDQPQAQAQQPHGHPHHPQAQSHQTQGHAESQQGQTSRISNVRAEDAPDFIAVEPSANNPNDNHETNISDENDDTGGGGDNHPIGGASRGSEDDDYDRDNDDVSRNEFNGDYDSGDDSGGDDYGGDDYGGDNDGGDNDGGGNDGGSNDGGDNVGGDDDGGDDYGDDEVDGGDSVAQNVNNFNRFRHPMLWRDKDMRTLIKIWKHEFINWCEFTRPATRRQCVLTAESRTFLYLYRITHDVSQEVLGALFGVSPKTAMKAYNDVLFFLLMSDHNIPSHDHTMTNLELESLLLQLHHSSHAKSAGQYCGIYVNKI